MLMKALIVTYYSKIYRYQTYCNLLFIEDKYLATFIEASLAFSSNTAFTTTSTSLAPNKTISGFHRT